MDKSTMSGAFDEYIYKGVRLSTFYHPRERLEAALAYTDWRQTDVVLQTFSKSGTNLCKDLYRNILEEAGIINENGVYDSPLEIENPLEKRRREKDGSRGTLHDLKETNDPRLIVTHIPIGMLLESIGNNNGLKIIHVRRNPKDVAISMFHFYKKMGRLPKDLLFDDFVNKFTDSNCVEGRQYFLNLRSWYEHRDDPEILSLQFEEIIKDLPATVRQIAEFSSVKLTEKQVERVAEKNKFERRQAEATEYEKLFLRQGKKGSWKSVLTVAQNERFDEWIAEGMKGMKDVQILYE